MKKEIAIAIGILIIGIAAAGLIDYYGKINGTIEVSEPVFYASDGHPSSNNQIWNLSIHDYISKEGSISISANKYFISPQLGINSMYPAKYRVYLDIETKEGVEGIINVNLAYVDDNLNEQMSICSIDGISINEKTIYQRECSVASIGSIDESYRLQMHIEDTSGPSVSYNIYAQGNTKIQISKT